MIVTCGCVIVVVDGFCGFVFLVDGFILYWYDLLYLLMLAMVSFNVILLWTLLEGLFT